MLMDSLVGRGWEMSEREIWWVSFKVRGMSKPVQFSRMCSPALYLGSAQRARPSSRMVQTQWFIVVEC